MLTSIVLGQPKLYNIIWYYNLVTNWYRGIPFVTKWPNTFTNCVFFIYLFHIFIVNPLRKCICRVCTYIIFTLIAISYISIYIYIYIIYRSCVVVALGGLFLVSFVCGWWMIFLYWHIAFWLETVFSSVAF